MDYKEFKYRVTYNSAVIKDALYKNEKIVTVIDNLYTFDSKPKELSSLTLVRKAYDIIPACYIGALASVKSNGTDAYIVDEENNIEHLEIKTSEVVGEQIWQGPKGGIRVGVNTGNDLKTALGANYTIQTQKIVESKKMRTVLMIADNRFEGFVDSYEIDSNNTGNLIQEKMKLKQSFSIGFHEFLKHGKQSQSMIPMMGYYNWIDIIKKTAPVCANRQARKSKNDKNK